MQDGIFVLYEDVYKEELERYKLKVLNFTIDDLWFF